MSRYFKKFLAVWVIGVLLFSGVAGIFIPSRVDVSGVLVPHQARAFWGVSDVSTDPWLISDSLANWAEQELLKALRDAVVRKLITMLRDQVIAAIQGNGNPMYVTDWTSLLDQGVDSAANRMMYQIGNAPQGILSSMLEQEISLLQQSGDSNYDSSRVSSLLQEANPYLNQLQTDGLGKIMQEQGWAGYDKMFSPDYSPLWLSIQAQDAFNNIANTSQNSSQNEAMSSNGFLSLKTCTAYQGGGSKDVISQLCSGNQSCMDSFCTNWQTETPGDLVAQTVGQSFNSDFTYTQNVESAISAIINALISEVLTKGLNSLTQSSDGSYQGTTIRPPKNSTTTNDTSTAQDLETTYGSQLALYATDYTNFLQLADATPTSMLDLANQAVAAAQGFDATCPTTTISYPQPSSGNQGTGTIDQLLAVLVSAQSDLTQLINTATTDLAVINSIDYSTVTLSTIQQLVADHSQFIANATYQAITLSQGSFAQLFSALNGFSCPVTAPPSAP